MEVEENSSRNVGKRAEEVAEWYFRLNGFFLIPGFIVHPDEVGKDPRTEADLLGIKLKNSKESIWRSSRPTNSASRVSRAEMTDDRIFNNASFVGSLKKHLVAMVEVKAGVCSINGPWSPEHAQGSRNNGKSNMERALSRVGFGDESQVSRAAASMYDELRYEGDEFVVQYFAVGKEVSNDLKVKYPKLIQITFNDIGTFLRWRFNGFPEKIPANASIKLWDGFGDIFARWFESIGFRSTPSEDQCQKAVKCFIERGDINIR